jgi:hypothetical protein
MPALSGRYAVHVEQNGPLRRLVGGNPHSSTRSVVSLSVATNDVFFIMAPQVRTSQFAAAAPMRTIPFLAMGYYNPLTQPGRSRSGKSEGT